MTITVISIGIVSGFLFVNYGNKVRNTFLASATYTPTTPTPTILPSAKEEVISSDSPDGKKKLTLKKIREGSLTAYSVFTSDIPEVASPSEVLIYEATIDSSQRLSIPYNTWSPDDAYVFLQEDSQAGRDYYVFSSTGGSFANGEQYLHIRDLFTKGRPEFTLTEVTGWAAPYLLIVNTITTDGTEGPSFWFDLSSQSFIQLSTRFN